MVFDTHTHTEMSSDSKMPAAQAISAARRAGLGIIFTEHYDADFSGEPGLFRVDAERYLSEYAPLRAPDVLLGVELGLTETSRAANLALVESRAFDFLLGSVHTVWARDIYMDFTGHFTGEAKAKNSERGPLITAEAYFKCVRDMLTSHDYIDSFGHIDYPHRYFSGPAAKLSESFAYAANTEAYDAIFDALIETGTAFEINTRRLGQYAAEKELSLIYRRYAEKGGKYVTIGSDAHNPRDIGANFKKALRIASESGLTAVCFRGRVMEEIK
ncbi:MAG: histidinol-phosphatase HisJ family protein [Clostridiales bacterium]|jgi:histidinol-phosphatase (PHP family)|nr:histidinol-phosphatase HisJ family protein [Clostridiales bacterium]